MNRIHITLDMAIAAMVAIVQDFGFDHKAGTDSGNGCVYGRFTGPDGQFIEPVCIVGVYMHRLGLLRALVVGGPCDGWQGACHVGSGVWEALRQYGVTADDDAQRFLASVQHRQDNDESWGDAVTREVEALQVQHERVVDDAAAAYDNSLARRKALLDVTGDLDALRPAPQQDPLLSDPWNNQF
jgi:hypothetical protein